MRPSPSVPQHRLWRWQRLLVLRPSGLLARQTLQGLPKALQRQPFSSRHLALHLPSTRPRQQLASTLPERQLPRSPERRPSRMSSACLALPTQAAFVPRPAMPPPWCMPWAWGSLASSTKRRFAVAIGPYLASPALIGASAMWLAEIAPSPEYLGGRLDHQLLRQRGHG